MIQEKAEYNQFFITSHSNIVISHVLKDKSNKVFQLANIPAETVEEVPTTKIKEINNSESETQLLASMGYYFSDFLLYEAWIIFEEASIEFIFREYFLNWYSPKLKNILRTISSKGIDNVDIRFRTLTENMMIYANMVPMYRNKVWVVADNGDKGKATIHSLRTTYKKWDPKNFILLSNNDFELYLPECFQERVHHILSMNHRERKDKKYELFNDVKQFLEV